MTATRRSDSSCCLAFCRSLSDHIYEWRNLREEKQKEKSQAWKLGLRWATRGGMVDNRTELLVGSTDQ